MKFCALCFKGLEDICSAEISDILSKKTEIKDGAVLFDCSEEEAVKLGYLSQTVNRIIKIIDSFEYNKGEEVLEKCSIDFSEYIEGSFAVKTEYIDGKIKIKDLSSRIAKQIKDCNDNFRYKNPDRMIIIYICYDEVYIGLDMGFDFSKRSYKIVTYGRDIKGTIAASLVRLIGFNGEGNFLDAFCVNGTIVIEAALLANKKSPWFFDKENFILDVSSFDQGKSTKKVYASGYQRRFAEACNKNATVMEVEDMIDVWAEDIDEMGHKIGEFDFILANLPVITENKKTGIIRLYDTFLNRVKEISSDKCKVLAFSASLEEFKSLLAEKGFSIVEERDIINGHEIIPVVVFEQK